VQWPKKAPQSALGPLFLKMQFEVFEAWVRRDMAKFRMSNVVFWPLDGFELESSYAVTQDS